MLLISGCPGSEPAEPGPRGRAHARSMRVWTTGLVLNTIVQHPPDPDEAVAQLARFERYCCTPSVAVEMMRRTAESDLTPFLQLIQAPTLVINDRDDPIVPLRQAPTSPSTSPAPVRSSSRRDYHASWHPRLRRASPPHRGVPHRSTRRSSASSIGAVHRRVHRHRAVHQPAADLGDATGARSSTATTRCRRTRSPATRGVFVKQTGDGMLAHFDSPGRVVACALTLMSGSEPRSVCARGRESTLVRSNCEGRT